MLKISEKNGDRVSVSKLKKYRLNDPDSITAKYFLLHVNILNKLGIGITHTIKSVFKERVLPIFKTKEYNFLQKISFIRGMRFSQKYFLNILMKKYPMEDCKSFEIPVYFFEGIYDYLVSSALAERYFEMLSAPKKKLYKFNNSSHCPHFEEPEIFKKIFFEDILKEADS
jgi:pimeloyl-ACP methyl ester carboxylesterase